MELILKAKDIRVVFSPMKNVNKLTVLPVRKLMDIMTITS